MTYRYEPGDSYVEPNHTPDFTVEAVTLKRLMPNEDWRSPDMQKTAYRWAKMMKEMTDKQSVAFDFTTFDSDADEMVIVRDIAFVTLCAHHLVPFMGMCHIAYIPNGQIAGLSKLPRLVKYLCKGTWDQESLTKAIAHEMQDRLEPVGVGVIMKGEHLCMSIRGAQALGTNTVTSCMMGAFADHSKLARQEFLTLLSAP